MRTYTNGDSPGNFAVSFVTPEPIDRFTRAATIFNTTMEVILYGICVLILLALIVLTLGFFIKGF